MILIQNHLGFNFVLKNFEFEILLNCLLNLNFLKALEQVLLVSQLFLNKKEEKPECDITLPKMFYVMLTGTEDHVKVLSCSQLPTGYGAECCLTSPPDF